MPETNAATKYLQDIATNTGNISSGTIDNSTAIDNLSSDVARGLRGSTDLANSTGDILTVTSSGAVTIATKSTGRKQLFIQNLSTSPCYIGYGITPSTTKYHILLGGSTSIYNGKGASVTEDLYIGAVSGYASTGKTVKLSYMEIK